VSRPKRLVILVSLLVALIAVLSWVKPAGALLDGRLHYSGNDAAAFIAALGAHGRRLYVVHECFDLAFIVTYSLLLRELAVYCRLRGAVSSPLPFIPGGLDLLETTGILALLGVFPAEQRELAGALGFCTLFKWLAAAALLIALSWSRIRSQAASR